MGTLSARSSLVPFRTAAQRLADRAARAYTAGLTIESLEQVCTGLHSRNLSTTVCYWNQNSDSPDKVAAAYARLIDMMCTFDRESYLSIKAPALKFDAFLIDQLVQRCGQSHLSLHFDSLSAEDNPATWQTVHRIYKAGVPLGVTLPARWRSSVLDAEAAVQMGLRVRVVKGQWPDIEQPDVDPSEGFLTLVNRLAGRAARVAVATHDGKLAAESLRRLKIAHTPCELEIMHGYPQRRMRRIAAAFGTPVRVYVPYGRAWLPYRVRSVTENPRVLVWFLRDLIRSA
jgi:proline dehydrogenase